MPFKFLYYVYYEKLNIFNNISLYKQILLQNPIMVYTYMC